MNSPITDPEALGRALLERVVRPSGKRPYLEITTPEGVYHLVIIEEPPLYAETDGKLTFVCFFGTPPLGRRQAFMWPSAEVPALLVTGIATYKET